METRRQRYSEATKEALVEVAERLVAAHGYSATSLDAPFGEEGLTPSDTLGEEDPSIAMTDEWASLAPVVEALAPRSRRVLYLRFFRGLTQSEIAQDIGVSQMHVSRILAQTIQQLREGVGADDVDPADWTEDADP